MSDQPESADDAQRLLLEEAADYRNEGKIEEADACRLARRRLLVAMGREDEQ